MIVIASLTEVVEWCGGGHVVDGGGGVVAVVTLSMRGGVVGRCCIVDVGWGRH